MSEPIKSEKIKVAHVTYDMRIGGTEMVIKNIIQGADPTLFSMSIFCIEEPLGPWGIELQQAGITIDLKARNAGFDTSLIFAIRKNIKQNNIDVLHCHQYTPWVYGVLAALGTKTRVIFTEHGRFHPDFSSWKRKLINPWLCKITNHITAISKATKQALIEYENIPEDRIDVIYNSIKPLSVNPDEVKLIKQQLGIDSSNFIFGTVARFDPIKNHQMMLHAFKLVKDQNENARLIIVGDGEEKQRIEETIRKLGLQQHVILTGYKTNPTDYLAMFNVFLLSSFSEGTSMTLLESMSIGKPCVVTNAGGNKEIIIDQSNGYVSENDNAIAFAESMLKLIKSQEFQKHMATQAKQRFEELFTQHIMSNNYKNLYLDKR